MSNAGVITIPDIKLYHRVVAIKTAWYWQKNRYEVQWNRTEDPDTNPLSYTHLILDKVAKTLLTALSTNVAGKSGYLLAENLN
jgi:hypothetical protein